MTLAEFKAWFEGFTENIEGEPSAKQWKKIKARVAEITGTPITEHHYWHRYWPGYLYGLPYNGWPYSTTTFGQAAGLGTSNASGVYNLNFTNQAWDGESAMRLLGYADAQAEAA